MATGRWHWKSESRSHLASTRWSSRGMPLVLAGMVGFATWTMTKSICVDYFIGNGQIEAAAIVLTFYYLLMALMIWCYARTYLTILYNPGLVPLGARAPSDTRQESQAQEFSAEQDLEARPYSATDDKNPDSPGLEIFYSTNIFACQSLGRPNWCAYCKAWKPDRAHHSREIQRCVYKMDHYCPWAGGMVSETSFKFFSQFVAYTSMYCGVCLITAAYVINDLMRQDTSVWPQLIALVVLAGFFGLFTFFLAAASGRFIFLNLTNVDVLNYKTVVHQLAIRVPRGTPWTVNYETVTYPLPLDSAPGGSKTNEAAPTQAETEGDMAVPLTEPQGLQANRDAMAFRTFALVRTEPGENPWDLGYYRNWESVMGRNIIDWLLPIQPSPCTRHDSNESMYPVGIVVDRLRTRYKLAMPGEGPCGIELGPQR